MLGVLTSLGSVLSLNLYARFAVVGIALFGAWTWQFYRGQSAGVKKVVQASQTAGKKRNEKSDKIRNRIKPSTAWKRLRQEYADGG